MLGPRGFEQGQSFFSFLSHQGTMGLARILLAWSKFRRPGVEMTSD